MARDWDLGDTRYLRRDPAARGRLMLSLGAGNPVSGELPSGGRAEIHFYLIGTAEMLYASCSTALATNSLLRKPNRRLRCPPHLVRPAVPVWIEAEGIADRKSTRLNSSH